MNTNCLVTKLMGSVDNSNLPKLGTLMLKIHATTDENPSDHVYIGRAVGKPLGAKTSGNYIAANSTDLANNPTAEISQIEGSLYYKSIGSDYIVELSPKYNISSITCQDGFNLFGFDISELNYCTELTRIILNPCNVYGELDCTLLTKLTNLGFSNDSDVRLDVGTLKNCSALSGIALPKKAYGDLLKLGKDMANAWQTSRDFTVSNTAPGEIYFGSYKMISIVRLNWDSTTKIYVKAPYAHKVYCSGYSSTEITNKQASGETWNGFEVTDVDTGNVYPV